MIVGFIFYFYSLKFVLRGGRGREKFLQFNNLNSMQICI